MKKIHDVAMSAPSIIHPILDGEWMKNEQNERKEQNEIKTTKKTKKKNSII